MKIRVTEFEFGPEDDPDMVMNVVSMIRSGDISKPVRGYKPVASIIPARPQPDPWFLQPRSSVGQRELTDNRPVFDMQTGDYLHQAKRTQLLPELRAAQEDSEDLFVGLKIIVALTGLALAALQFL